MKKIFLSSLIVLTLTAFYNPICFAQCPISYYVAPTGNDANSCFLPGTPCKTIQHAIDFASGTETCPAIIHVAGGTYNEHIVMDSWESLEGGWNSDFTQQWDFENDGLEPNPAYLTVIDGEDNGTCITQLEKSGANINGLTIQNGRGVAGGIYLDHSHPNVTNCILKDNVGVEPLDDRYAAGGIVNHYSSPTVSNCDFVDNASEVDYNWTAFAVLNEHSQAIFTKCSFTGGIYFVTYFGAGNGIVNIYSAPIISECRFEENSSDAGVHGPVVNIYSSPLITRCSFIRNRTDEEIGSAMYNWESNVLITNSEFIGNYIDDIDGDGVAIANSFSQCTIINCTFADNRSSHKEVCGVITNFNNSHSILWNSIVWDNIYMIDDSPEFGPIGLCNFDESSTFEVYHSNIDQDEDGFAVINGNISQNPLFIQSGWDDNGTPDVPSDDVWVGGDYHLQQDSPCIDAGVGAGVYDDIDGDSRPQGAGYDIGADEYVSDISIDAILEYFYNCVDAETIEGRGRKPWIANIRLWLFGQMLEFVKWHLDHDWTKFACRGLNSIDRRCDGDRRPPDFIDGDAVALGTLTGMLDDLAASLGCE